MNKRNPTTKVTPARSAALNAVTQCRVRNAFAQDIIDHEIDTSSMSPQDRAFAAKLVLGVVKTRGVLDEILNRCMDSPHDISNGVRDALCISTYEIIFLNKSIHAAVDQGVELVRSVAPRASGLVNAVLHRVVEAKKDFPYGDPTSDSAAYARKQGFPLWLSRRLTHDIGDNNARAFMDISNETAPVFIAVNAVKVQDEKVVSLLDDAGGKPRKVSVNGQEVSGCYHIENARVLLDETIQKTLDDGWLLVSDAAAQMVVQQVIRDNQANSFLEIGAGKGTKTILFQSSAWRNWNKQIKDYVVLDNRQFKIDILLGRSKDYSINVSQALAGSVSDLEMLIDKSHTFDTVFIDAPCSGLGTLRRHCDIRWRLTPEAITDNAKLGFEMLQSAARYVNEGGLLAYSTCTVTPEENEDVIERFLKSEQGKGFYLDSNDGGDFFKTLLVSGGNDAHFLAKMRKSKIL